jgi:hypothetical protein
MAKYTDTKDPEIERLVNQLVPDGQQADMGITAFDGPAPSYTDDDEAGAGTESIKRALASPRIDLMHALSPRVRDGLAKEGQFYHTSADEPLEAPLRFIVCKATEGATLWRPRSQGGGRLATARDLDGAWDPSNAVFDDITPDGYGKKVVWKTRGSVAESGLLQWGSMDPDNREAGGFAGTASVNVLAYFPDHPDLLPAVISCFKRSGYDAGCTLNTQLKTLKHTKGKAAYSCLFQLSTRMKKGPKGTFLIPVVQGIGWASKRDRMIAKSIYEASKGSDLMDAIIEAEAAEAGHVVPDGNEDAGARY